LAVKVAKIQQTRFSTQLLSVTLCNQPFLDDKRKRSAKDVAIDSVLFLPFITIMLGLLRGTFSFKDES
jgi:hypothetical protein